MSFDYWLGFVIGIAIGIVGSNIGVYLAIRQSKAGKNND